MQIIDGLPRETDTKATKATTVTSLIMNIVGMLVFRICGLPVVRVAIIYTYSILSSPGARPQIRSILHQFEYRSYL